ncbi:MAG: class I SAM-dependent methyltransferase [Candidatus Gastranaerophilales bacterium]|nr:class I SAM-dependent methyltransferase [Candidatus Gastranaerophilales bacterium]
MEIKKILSFPQIYILWQKIVGDYKLRKIYCRDYIRTKRGDSILDIGCGPANMVHYLPKDIKYVGFDDSELYIKNAQKKFPQKNYQFFCQKINFIQNFDEKFDIIMANAILHHIDDEEAKKLISFAKSNLKQGGRFITHDGCYTQNQSKIKKWLLKNDRGLFVRTKDEYFELFSKYFDNINIIIREDLYNIPYTIIIFECFN